MNHSKLIEILSRTVKDGRVVSLIHKYLNAGVMVDGCREETLEGVPQGGPLSPLLSNVMLNELDRCLDSRGHRFVRYADDCMIFCKSRRAAERVRDSITWFVEGRLLLKVNCEKTGTGSVCGKKFLGYSFYFDKEGKCQLRLHPKTITKLKAKLKELTGRSNGMGYAQRKEVLKLFIRGWVEYYKLARMKNPLETIDQWLRRRIRMCIWKSWKNPRTRISNLIKCGVPKWQAYKHGWIKGYWRAAGMWDCTYAMSNHNLYRAGYRCLMDYYVSVS